MSLESLKKMGATVGGLPSAVSSINSTKIAGAVGLSNPTLNAELLGNKLQATMGNLKIPGQNVADQQFLIAGGPLRAVDPTKKDSTPSH